MMAMKKFLLIAAVLIVPMQTQAADSAAGREKSKVCAACHGETGADPLQDNPKLAGQHYSYLVQALNDYQSGKRKNPVMSGMVANLTKRDILDLAAFYAAQPPALQTKY